ncbi:hypothetical protein K469DRAFT_1700 [Zopfia rhizophila CBS 207.26]|uniref:Integral membrane protein n=1 Tax=Zopfia rhizophila CBS 207.26 TaxID=1314779 RepID=A0A6A6EUV7_9PEZI|nr:hypothetical protein K469DRAFT_1700 [Zopfia rhizophila CBS 207.26]
MAHTILISYIVCFSGGLILTVGLIYLEVRPRRTNEMDRIVRIDDRWERALAVLSGLVQVGLLIADIAAIAITLASNRPVNWLDLAILCTLQLLVVTNLARLIRFLFIGFSITWLLYVVAVVWTIHDVVIYLFRNQHMPFVYESVLLFLVIAPLLSLLLSYSRLRQHKNSGQINPGYKNLLLVFIVTNAIAALFMLCGAIIILCFILWATAKIDIRLRHRLRQSIFLACICSQLLCALGFCLGGIKRRIIEPIRARMVMPRSTGIDGDDLGGAVRLASL